MKEIIPFALLFFGGFAALAQSGVNTGNNAVNTVAQPFLFSVNTLTGSRPYYIVNAGTNYAERTAGQFGYDGTAQQIGVKGYLGNRFTFYANNDLGFSRGGGLSSAQQAEVIRDVVGSRSASGLRLGVGLGGQRDFSSVWGIFSRLTASYEAAKWRLGGNMRLERAFSNSRDGIDLVTSFGFQHRLKGALFAGVEAMGQDLEGFWEADEAEGGAKLMVGPSLNYAPLNSRFSFSLAGGPVFYATRSGVAPSGAIRDISNSASQNGYSVRAMVFFSLQRF